MTRPLLASLFALLSSTPSPLDAAPPVPLMSSDAASITLTISGQCPGLADFTVRGATPNDLVVLAFGAAGSSTRPRNPCAGMTLPLANPRLGGVLPSNVSGIAYVQITLASGACGKTVVAVDVATCTVSPPVVL